MTRAAARGRVERQRIEPDGAQTLAQRRLAQIGEPDTVRARIGKRRVGGAGAGEFGVQLDDVADIDHDQERRAAFFGRQRAGVAFGLCAGAQHGVVEAARGNVLPQALGFEHEGAAAVAVDAAFGFAAVAMAKAHAPLEDVGVLARVLARRVGLRQIEQPREFGDEELVVGEFGAARRAASGR